MGYIGSMHKDSLICGMATNLQGNWKRLIVTDLRNWGSVRTVSRATRLATDQLLGGPVGQLPTGRRLLDDPIGTLDRYRRTGVICTLPTKGSSRVISLPPQRWRMRQIASEFHTSFRIPPRCYEVLGPKARSLGSE